MVTLFIIVARWSERLTGIKIGESSLSLAVHGGTGTGETVMIRLGLARSP